MPPIGFNETPSNVRVPFVFVEIDNSMAQQGPALLPYRALLAGQMTSAGTGTANALYKVTNASQVQTLAGRGSMLHRMAIQWFKNNSFTETWIGLLADNGAGVAASGTLTFSGTVTAPGTLALYLGGELIEVAVAAGESNGTTATNVAAAINDNDDLPVTASANSAVVTITQRHKGLVGNQYDMRVNYQDDEELPAGLAVAIVAMASGTTAPTLTTLISAMADTWFQVVVHPYTDATSLTAIEGELSDRFASDRMIDGVAFTASNESHANLTTLGDGRNSPHSCIVATNQSPTPGYEIAAAIGAVAAYYGNIDPARPFQTLPLKGVKAPNQADEFTMQERNLLLYDGISTIKQSAGGVMRVDRLITTYQTNAAGAADTSYLDVNTMLTLLYLRYSFRNRILNRYPRHKLADDGARAGAGQPLITPKLGKAEAMAWFREMEEIGLVENFSDFKTNLVVERNISDPNRLDFLLPPDLVNQFIVGAAQIQFRL